MIQALNLRSLRKWAIKPRISAKKEVRWVEKIEIENR